MNWSVLETPYLSIRKQRVAINWCYLKFAEIKFGVLSVLGPPLCLVWIYDLEKDIKSKVKFFSDDTMLYSMKDPVSSASDLNHEIEKID